MNVKALRTLEFFKITEMLKERCVSVPGKEIAAELAPVSDIIAITERLRETSEAAGMIYKKGAPPFGGIRDIREQLKRVEVGGTLSVEELSAVLDFLYVLKKMNGYGKIENRGELYPLLDGRFGRIAVFPALEAEIDQAVLPPNELNDNASPELSRLRRQMKIAAERIREHLNKIIRSGSVMLQDAVITTRNGRYCVPVKQEYRAQFNGMVHDQSSTGATFFMEPMSVVTLNNNIKELHSAEKNEIERILKKLSTLVGEQSEFLNEDMEILTGLDFAFAKGTLSISMGATEPALNAAGRINIKRGRHPLLARDSVVPIDINLGFGFNTLLITGPNTGGKTVALKTIGLLTLMGQAGLHIPAFDNSELNVFDDVFADIGDEQSIEQSLSTFSSHMGNIVGVLNEITENSLVLLDELGAGTDPTEGAALAIAILDYLNAWKVRAAVTTHYSELKVYAIAADGVENASCEFDVETLRPTYRLLIGVPGKSNAFEISRRLGLPETIVSNARNVLSREDQRFEDVITDLEISRKTVIMERERAEGIRREAEALKKEFETLKDKLSAQREKMIAEAKDEARQIYVKAEAEAGAIIREMNKTLMEHGERSRMHEARQQLKENLSGLSVAQIGGAVDEKLEQLTAPVEKNMRVFVGSLNKPGVVINAPDAGGDALVQMGVMKMKINVSDLYREPESQRTIQTGTVGSANAKSAALRPEIDLRGMVTEEGLEACDKYLDDAYLSSLDKVTLIHGKGTGALRRAIHAFLKTNPRVLSYRIGKFGEGEDGVTIVELKKES